RRDQDRVEVVLPLYGGARGDVERQVKRRHVAVRELDAAIRALFRAVADLGKNRPAPRRRIGSRLRRRLALLTAACRLGRRRTRFGRRLLLLPTTGRLARRLTSFCLRLRLFPLLYAQRLDDIDDASLG